MTYREQPFSRNMRLLKPLDFRKTFSEGKRSHSPLFRVVARKNNLQQPRLGLAISRKTTRFAVDRNRIKRVIRESFRINTAVIGARDVVVQATPKTQTKTNQALALALDVMWRELTP